MRALVLLALLTVPIGCAQPLSERRFDVARGTSAAPRNNRNDLNRSRAQAQTAPVDPEPADSTSSDRREAPAPEAVIGTAGQDSTGSTTESGASTRSAESSEAQPTRGAEPLSYSIAVSQPSPKRGALTAAIISAAGVLAIALWALSRRRGA